MEEESGVTQSIIDQIHSSYLQGAQIEGENMVLLEVSLMNFILWISNDNKRKVKVVLFGVSLKNFIFRISKEIKRNVKVILFEVSLMNFILGIS